MLPQRSLNHDGRQSDPIRIGSEISALLVDAFVFQLHLKDAREARIQAARTVAESQALRAEANQIVERSRAVTIRYRPGEVRSPKLQLPSPRKMRSLYVQAHHECQRFFQLASELTNVIEHSAEAVTNSVRYGVEFNCTARI